jgi:hypothetical protein
MDALGKSLEVLAQVRGRLGAMAKLGPASAPPVENPLQQLGIGTMGEGRAEIRLGPGAVVARPQLSPDHLQLRGTAPLIERQAIEGHQGIVGSPQHEKSIHASETRFSVEQAARIAKQVSIERRQRGRGVVVAAQEQEPAV